MCLADLRHAQMNTRNVLGPGRQIRVLVLKAVELSNVENRIVRQQLALLFHRMRTLSMCQRLEAREAAIPAPRNVFSADRPWSQWGRRQTQELISEPRR